MNKATSLDTQLA